MQKGEKQQTAANVASPLKAGTPAPDFTLRSTPDSSIVERVSRQADDSGVLPGGLEPVCGDQLALYKCCRSSNASTRLDGYLGRRHLVSCAYARDRKLHFPLLADFQPKGETAQGYGAYRSQDGVCERALFVIDPEGSIAWSYVSPIGVNPGADGILAALEALPSSKKQGTGHAQSAR